MVTSRSEPVGDASFDVVVVGAGPAGLAATFHALSAGSTVALVDAGAGPGGQFWRHPRRSSADSRPRPEHVAYLHHDLSTYRLLVEILDRERSSGHATYLAEHDVWTVSRDDDGFVVHAVDRDGRSGATTQLRARRLVLATGAYDRQVPFPGWELPGVMTAGGVQALLKAHHVQAGRRILVAGTGPFLLSVAAGLASSGAQVAGVHESSSLRGLSGYGSALLRNPGKALEGAGYARTLARHRVPVHTRSVVLAAHGGEELEAVTVGRIAADGSIVRGSERRVVVDVLAVGWGFTPQLELPLTLGCATRVDADGSQVCVVGEDQETSVPGVFVAGEACGVGGAELAVVEGGIAGAAAGAVAAGSNGQPSPVGRLGRRRRDALRRFARAMHDAHPVPAVWTQSLEHGTVLCRCEEVTVGDLRAAVEELGAADARDAKLLSRAGMGWCQGRVCGYATACLTASWSGQPYTPGRVGTRPVATPVRLGDLADTDDGGD